MQIHEEAREQEKTTKRTGIKLGFEIYDGFLLLGMER